jgi:hypothetical protein
VGEHYIGESDFERFNVNTGRFGVVLVGELTTHIASIHEQRHCIVISTLNRMVSIQFVIEFSILCEKKEVSQRGKKKKRKKIIIINYQFQYIPASSNLR